jgi:hypothetical protein
VTHPTYPFTTDGCSGGMTHVWRVVFRCDPPWNDLCVEHDKSYWAGGTVEDRRRADRKLMAGVVERGYPIWAFLMWASVRLGGHPLLPLPWRWAYGFPYPHAYDKPRS